ncbi:MAG: hypothetical protein HQK91_14350 [Nitrospirae bacterium]|nr:hypothetical protein [Nitrospirota bacterium]MBF0542619.1 hypothetical protein [Nitrospirota bacterium]
MQKSVSEKVYQVLYDEGLIDEQGEVIDEHFHEEIKFLIEGVLRDTRVHIQGIIRPFLKHLLLLKYYHKQPDRRRGLNKWKIDTFNFLEEIKIDNCIDRKSKINVQTGMFVYDTKKVHIKKEVLQRYLNDAIMDVTVKVNKKYGLNIDDIRVEDIDGFKIYDNDVQVIEKFSNK